MTSRLRLAALDPEKIDRANQHLARHVFESGRYGVHWLPYDPASLPSPPSVNSAGLELAYDQVGWERWYVVELPTDQVIGHVSLKGARFDRGLHRCELGMGIEKPYWRQGWGSVLLEHVMDHARSVPNVDWLDLHVLGSNQPAINLYQKHGFDEVSRTPDFCRIDGVPDDDVLMTLRVN